ncbi:hypothetical protein [Limnochorda pilosa]|uniref:Uncharacterized protein n=1 Tax=Limnochorda pilosa TaxID=1555112 RepID=A0A0K2SQH7_LIMPI|nr:hypothetical protein [Limnochorda pilosa]BAS29356.1 hypothetical protein LIP_3545 [Limnochorda pilosa]
MADCPKCGKGTMVQTWIDWFPDRTDEEKRRSREPLVKVDGKVLGIFRPLVCDECGYAEMKVHPGGPM